MTDDSHPVVAGAVYLVAYAIIVGTFFVILVLLDRAFGADVDGGCLTKEQAREKYPRAWLYWHTKDRCWDNVPTGRYTSRRGVYGKTNSLKLAKPHLDASGNIVRVKQLSADEIDGLQFRDEAEKRLRTCCWPALSPFKPWHDRIEGNL